MKYTITIEEHLSQNFVVEADSAEEAMSIAVDKYYAADFVIDSCDVSTRLMQVSAPKSAVTEWSEF